MENNDCNKIFRNEFHPYYIYTPRWIETSAGIKVLHYLCHALNNSGQKAFLILSEGAVQGQPRVSGFLNTPILTPEIANSHFRAKLVPITVYSETVPGNPLQAPFVVRYLLNYVGALNGPNSLNSTDFLVAFSENIKKHTLNNFGRRNIFKLFLPPVDPREFKFTTEKVPGRYAIYNGKYKVFGLGQIGDLKENMVLIEREGKNAPNRSDLKKILNSAEAVIAFENSSIITEAIMSGTVGVFYPNDFLTEVIAEKELGWGGTLWGWNVDDLPEAKKTLDLARENYFLQIKKFLIDLEIFIEQTQFSVSKLDFEKPVRIPTFRTFVTRHRLQLAYETYKNVGLRALFKQTLDFFKRRVTTAKIRKNDPFRGRETLEFELQ